MKLNSEKGFCADELTRLKQRLTQLKQHFDDSFSLATDLVTAQTTQVLMFKMSGEIYAIPLVYIQQVLVDFNITLLPFSPAFIEGVINLNGEVLSVCNIHGFFNLSRSKGNDDNHSQLVVIKNLDFDTAFLVDEVLTAADVELDAQQGSSEVNSRVSQVNKLDFIERTFFYKGQLVMLIAVENLMASPLMQVNYQS